MVALAHHSMGNGYCVGFPNDLFHLSFDEDVGASMTAKTRTWKQMTLEYREQALKWTPITLSAEEQERVMTVYEKARQVPKERPMVLAEWPIV